MLFTFVNSPPVCRSATSNWKKYGPSEQECFQAGHTPKSFCIPSNRMMHPFQLVVGYIPIDTRIFEHTQIIRTSQCVGAQFERGLWRNGSASDSRSEGWAFESLWPHLTNFITHQQPRTKQEIHSNVYCDERDHDRLPNNQCVAHVGKCAHAGSRTRVTSMGGLYDAVTLHALGNWS